MNTLAAKSCIFTDKLFTFVLFTCLYSVKFLSYFITFFVYVMQYYLTATQIIVIYFKILG